VVRINPEALTVPATASEPTLLLTREQVARLLIISERGLVNLEARGIFKPLRLGAAVRYRRCDVEAKLAELAEAQR
jgi:hypothetical protein